MAQLLTGGGAVSRKAQLTANSLIFRGPIEEGYVDRLAVAPRTTLRSPAGPIV